MLRWRNLSIMAVLLLVVCGSAQGQEVGGQGQPRFSKAANGVITDSATGLQWYVNPNRDTKWHQAKAWTENLTVAGGGWRLPTVAELKAVYQKDASPYNMDPVFQAPAVWAWSGELNNAWSVWGFAFYNGLEGWHSMNYGNGRMTLAVRSRR
jgi:hypothetical protein